MATSAKSPMFTGTFCPPGSARSFSTIASTPVRQLAQEGDRVFGVAWDNEPLVEHLGHPVKLGRGIVVRRVHLEGLKSSV